jgi:hypothetical protein
MLLIPVSAGMHKCLGLIYARSEAGKHTATLWINYILYRSRHHTPAQPGTRRRGRKNAPEGKQCSRQGCLGREVPERQRHAQTGILHADFNGKRQTMECIAR